MREKALLELTTVRGDAQSARFTAAVRKIFGTELPVLPNTVAAGPTHAALWLGPDEWLLVSNDARLPRAERTLRRLLSEEVASVVDVSSGYTALALSGPRVREILQKGCPLDLHPRVFAVGQCAQSHFFKSGIIIRPVGTGNYELIVRRSFADYTARMLLDAADL